MKHMAALYGVQKNPKGFLCFGYKFFLVSLGTQMTETYKCLPRLHYSLPAITFGIDPYHKGILESGTTYFHLLYLKMNIMTYYETRT